MNERVVRDGKVAALISTGYGAGWSSWCHNPDQAEAMLFHPKLVEAAEANVEDIRPVLEELGIEAYDGGWYGAEMIHWIPAGTEFIVTEYDGYESIQVKKQTKWMKA